QVEHPVTECVTGLDLVALQIQVANGRPLGFSQEDVRLQGHAIEVRFYAEDPAQDFLPSTGRILHWQPPLGEGVRVDAGIESGSEVSPYYDAMVAKIIARGRDREEARRRLVRALASTVLIGTHTNRDFLIDALERAAFISGEATTAFIEETYGPGGYTVGPPGVRLLAAAAVIQHRLSQRRSLARSVSVSAELLDWSSAADLESVRVYLADDRLHTLTVRPGSEGSYDVSMDEARAHSVEVVRLDAGSGKLLIDRIAVEVHFHALAERVLHLVSESSTLTLTDLSGGVANDTDAGGGGTVLAPMHGMLLEVLAGEGDRVAKGDKLAVLEAMKMQHEILAETDGTVISVLAAAGRQIAAGDHILEIQADAADA
ncbi:MAG: 3-methylcrotonyl-CoA carboxylase, partial [Pseudomonadales bacterium]|nr:3-methylcrotonyl-CoA carboxylase [Pseudomonadales bacterium]